MLHISILVTIETFSQFFTCHVSHLCCLNQVEALFNLNMFELIIWFILLNIQFEYGSYPVNKQVGGLEHFLCFYSVGNVIIPTDELIFFGGVGPPPTSKPFSTSIPRCSMYGIFTYIWAIFGVNIGKYSIHGASGIWFILLILFISR